MATITHLYDINQTVWLLDPDTGITECIVLDVSTSSRLSGVSISYGLKIVKTNSQTASDQSSLYGILSGVGSALEAYEAILVA